MATKNKKVNLTNLNKVANKVFTKRKLTVQIEGQNFDIMVNEVFRDSDIELATLEIANMQQQCEEVGLQVSPFILSNLSLVKTFSDIQFPQEIEQQIQLFSLICDLGILEKIFACFSQEELDKLNKKAEDMAENLPKVIDLLKGQIDKQVKIIENINNKIESESENIESDKNVELDKVDDIDA